ncbi:MAG: NUDIX domain-containing protein [Thermoguttaceae bacterium]|nr:NUDIX domain-containing protein [Thermoguttaceae bacterium]MBR4751401.1 NUDIX domain-containing protein [Thermoguttaceae bacterium]
MTSETGASIRAKRMGAVAILPRPPFVLSPGQKIDFSRMETLVIRRSANVAAPGALCFPGGGVEQGESPEEAVCREFREEVGIDVRVVRFLAENTTPSGAPLYWFSAESVERDPDALRIVVQPEEVAGYEWRALVDLLDDPDFLSNNLAIVRKIVAGEIALA